MIIDYNDDYIEQVKDLLVELQEHIVAIDKEGYNILIDEYRDKYFSKTINEIKENNGKMFLYKDNDKILGLIVGLINNEKENSYDFKCPKRGRITEFVVSKKSRSCGVGTHLLKHMETYLKSVRCEDILLEVFAYNDDSIKFYEKNGYHNRIITMTKKLD